MDATTSAEKLAAAERHYDILMRVGNLDAASDVVADILVMRDAAYAERIEHARATAQCNADQRAVASSPPQIGAQRWLPSGFVLPPSVGGDAASRPPRSEFVGASPSRDDLRASTTTIAPLDGNAWRAQPPPSSRDCDSPSDDRGESKPDGYVVGQRDADVDARDGRDVGQRGLGCRRCWYRGCSACRRPRGAPG